MKWAINSREYRVLSRTVHYAIKNALRQRSQSEPQLVANLVWELPRAINSISFTEGWALKAGGVFVHAQPLVKCNSFPDSIPASVEIGDLLLLRSEMSGGKISGQRAVLLQAKKVSSFPTTPDNANQHHLYAAWPHFQYVRSTTDLNGKRRHVTGFDLYDASRFLLITDHACCLHCPPPRYHYNSCMDCVQTASPTQPQLSHYRSFETELLNFILGDAGKSFKVPKHPSNKNWDRVIEDLTSITAEKRSSFVKRAAVGSKDKRGQGILMAFLSGIQPTTQGVLGAILKADSFVGEKINDSSPQVPENWPGENDQDEGGGISIIEFVVSNDAEAGRK